jgi:hypothetical protein
MLARALNALGLVPGAAVAPAAKMTKKTLTTKRVEMEESDEEESAEAEEEEEEGESTGSTGDDGSSTGSTGSEAEEEEEEGEAEEDGKAAKYEEEESKALTRAVSKALNSTSVHQAFLAALPSRYRDVGALYSPHRLAAAAKKATGERSTFGAMGALSELNKRSRGATEKVLAKQAKLESRVARVEGARRQDRVAAIVAVAKERGVPGATTREGRAMLRDYGMSHGTKALSAFIQSQGPGLRTHAAIPRTDEDGAVLGMPASDQQKQMMDRASAGLSGKELEAFNAIAAEKLKLDNGAGKVEA